MVVCCRQKTRPGAGLGGYRGWCRLRRPPAPQDAAAPRHYTPTSLHRPQHRRVDSKPAPLGTRTKASTSFVLVSQ
uniref:Uncharacterized protein n=1 Tax=Timema cristinae TaxID=61476 RepID=A0A7R9GV91_TIMCR|nr:unnamed protein product [Timema cristinae]